MSRKLTDGKKPSPSRLVGSTSALVSAISLLAVSLGATEEAAAEVKKQKAPDLMQHSATGAHYKKAQLIARKAGKGQLELRSDQQKTNLTAPQSSTVTARKAGKGQQEYIKVKMNDALITSRRKPPTVPSKPTSTTSSSPLKRP